MEHGVKGEKTCFCSEIHLLKPPSEGAATSPPPSPANSHEGSESEKARGGPAWPPLPTQSNALKD